MTEAMPPSPDQQIVTENSEVYQRGLAIIGTELVRASNYLPAISIDWRSRNQNPLLGLYCEPSEPEGIGRFLVQFPIHNQLNSMSGSAGEHRLITASHRKDAIDVLFPWKDAPIGQEFSIEVLAHRLMQYQGDSVPRNLQGAFDVAADHQTITPFFPSTLRRATLEKLYYLAQAMTLAGQKAELALEGKSFPKVQGIIDTGLGRYKHEFDDIRFRTIDEALLTVEADTR